MAVFFCSLHKVFPLCLWCPSRKILWRRKWQPTTVILAWKISWMDSGRLQSMGSQRVGHNWETSLYFNLFSLQHALITPPFFFFTLITSLRTQSPSTVTFWGSGGWKLQHMDFGSIHFHPWQYPFSKKWISIYTKISAHRKICRLYVYSSIIHNCPKLETT